jgi:iron complex transport system ATP-binding protein
MTPTLFEVRGAAFQFGERRVFEELNFDVHAGEVLTILGPNGCGKSTLLRCLGGALMLTRGSVHLEGVDLASLDVRSRARKIAFLFQDHTPSFPFAVLDVVSMGRAPHLSSFGSPSGADILLAEEALEQVGMGEFKHRPYTELSGGERQLVLLARTLVQQPTAILLDEPTAHLDFKNQVRSLIRIGALAGKGVTMIMTTHDPNHAFLFPGRALLMHPGGRIVIGAPAEVITEAALSASYGIGISVLGVGRPDGLTAFKFCTPWYNQRT